MLYDSLPPTLTTKSINDIVKGDIIHMMRLMDTELELFILDERSCGGISIFS